MPNSEISLLAIILVSEQSELHEELCVFFSVYFVAKLGSLRVTEVPHLCLSLQECTRVYDIQFLKLLFEHLEGLGAGDCFLQLPCNNVKRLLTEVCGIKKPDGVDKLNLSQDQHKYGVHLAEYFAFTGNHDSGARIYWRLGGQASKLHILERIQCYENAARLVGYGHEYSLYCYLFFSNWMLRWDSMFTSWKIVISNSQSTSGMILSLLILIVQHVSI